MKRYSKFFGLRYENLEQRILLAGDVSVFESDHLYIRGDDLNNQIQIIADHRGQITVAGLNNTTVNGSETPFVVHNSIDLSGVRGRNASFDGGVRVLTYGGHDRIDVRGIELGDSSRIITGEGNDFVRLIRSTSVGEAVINTSSGEDTVKLVQTRTRGGLNIGTGSGDDSLEVNNSRTWADTKVLTGPDHDRVQLSRVRFTGQVQAVATQSGNDVIEFSHNSLNESGLGVFSGEGNDEVFAEIGNAENIQGEILFAGQQGVDKLEMSANELAMTMIKEQGFEDETDSQIFRNAEVFDDATISVVYPSGSGETLWRPAASVSFAQDTAVSSIEWQGAYLLNELLGDVPERDNFVVEIFENGVFSQGGDEPYDYDAPSGEPVAKFNIGGDVDRTETDSTWGHADNKVFVYSAEIDFVFKANTTYWISIFSDVDVEITGGNAYTFQWGYEEIDVVPGNFQNSIQYPGLDYFFTRNGSSFELLFALNA